PADEVRERMLQLALAWTQLESRTSDKASRDKYRDRAIGIFEAELAKPKSKEVLEEIYKSPDRPDSNTSAILLHARTLLSSDKLDDAALTLSPLLKSSAWRTYWILLSYDISNEMAAVKWLNQVTPVLSSEDSPQNVKQKNDLAMAWKNISI